jgi:hypothetical protein
LFVRLSIDGWGYSQVFLDCPVDLALIRNASREHHVGFMSDLASFKLQQVQEHIIRTMAVRLEPESAHHPWEKHSIHFDATLSPRSDVYMQNLETAVGAIRLAALDPLPDLALAEAQRLQQQVSFDVIISNFFSPTQGC